MGRDDEGGHRLTDLIVPEDVEWVRVTELRPGDQQIFAGRLLTVAVVIPDGRRTRVMYDEVRERYWGNGVQVQRLIPDGHAEHIGRHLQDGEQ